jgi:DnaJ-domain-containing protein 1
LKRHRQGVIATHEDPREILGVGPNAGDEEIRAAYLRKVKENPPDRSPAAFERVRDAYEILGDPRRRALHMLLSADPEAPLVSLLPARTGERRFTGPGPWLAVLREK